MQVTAEEVNDQLKDAIEYYIDSSTEPHFDQCDEDLYEPLPLDAVDENIGKLVTKHERPAADDEVRGQGLGPGIGVGCRWLLPNKPAMRSVADLEACTVLICPTVLLHASFC